MKHKVDLSYKLYRICKEIQNNLEDNIGIYGYFDVTNNIYGNSLFLVWLRSQIKNISDINGELISVTEKKR